LNRYVLPFVSDEMTCDVLVLANVRGDCAVALPPDTRYGVTTYPDSGGPFVGFGAAHDTTAEPSCGEAVAPVGVPG
jgi:hypothetical protein